MRFKIFSYVVVFAFFSAKVWAGDLESSKVASDRAFGENNSAFSQSQNPSGFNSEQALHQIAAQSQLTLAHSSRFSQNATQVPSCPQGDVRNIQRGVISGFVDGGKLGTKPGIWIQNQMNRATLKIGDVLGNGLLGFILALPFSLIFTAGVMLMAVGATAGAAAGSVIGAAAEVIKPGSTKNWPDPTSQTPSTKSSNSARLATEALGKIANEGGVNQ